MNQTTIKDTALVLEGGGTRGAFTAGVLDLFMDNNIRFPYVIGVSAGATNALSYLSNQRGRAIYANTTLLHDHPYIGLKSFLKCGEFVDLDFLFNDFLHSIYPFDLDHFFANMSDFEMVVTNNVTGQPCYITKPNSVDRLVLAGKATSSLPFINRAILMEGVAMSDGGLTDSIPLQRAFDKGYKKAVVILTQNRGYRKKRPSICIPRFITPKYPKIAQLLNDRPDLYNKQLEFIEQLEDRGEITVIRPTQPLRVGRLCRNTELITDLYHHGYDSAKSWLNQSIGLS